MERTKVRRMPKRASYDRGVIDAICDEALICHVGFVAPHGPVVIPTTFVRVDDTLYVHGSSVSGMLTTLANGVDACVTITLIDALIYAKSAFHHSVNYRSVVVFGHGTEVVDSEVKFASLAALVDKVEPGRSRECRLPNAKELEATCVIAMPLAEASAKVRTGGPIDDAEDAALPYWAGTIPLVTTRGARVPV